MKTIVNISTNNGARKIMYGTVKSYELGQSKSGKKQYRLVLEVEGRDETLFLTDRSESRGIASRFEGMKVRIGSNVLVDAHYTEGFSRGYVDGIAYERSMIRYSDGDRDKYVFVSYVTRPHDFGNGNFGISLPVITYNREAGAREKRWYGISFIGEEAAKHAKSVLENASLCAVVADSLREETAADGHTYRTLLGRHVYKLSERKDTEA